MAENFDEKSKVAHIQLGAVTRVTAYLDHEDKLGPVVAIRLQLGIFDDGLAVTPDQADEIAAMLTRAAVAARLAKK